jgi:hypothetical protein
MLFIINEYVALGIGVFTLPVYYVWHVYHISNPMLNPAFVELEELRKHQFRWI